MDTTKITNVPDRCFATGVDLWVKDGGDIEWVDDECAGCGGEHRYSAGNYKNDPRRTLGYRTAPCAKPEPGTPLAIAAEALGLNLGVLVLVDSDPDATADTLKIMGLMGFAGLMGCGVDGDDSAAIEGVMA